MHYTLWQQFSSNHSANFTLVGRFATARKAQTVGKEIRTFLRTLGAYWDETGGLEYDDEEGEYSEELTPPEEEFQAKYNLTTYETALDWCQSEGTADDVLHVYRDFVVLIPDNETWNETAPFAEFIEKRGGVPLSTSGMEVGSLLFRLHAIFASEVQATDAWNQIEQETDIAGTPTFRISSLPFVTGNVSRDDATIRFDDVDVLWPEGYPGLKALFDFVEAFPDVSITYEFYQSMPATE